MRDPKWPWVARQQWENLLFLHWPVQVEELRPYVPSPFNIETYNGRAWISIVPFRASWNGFRGMPGKLPFSDFLEINVRTYVNFYGEPGVYFLSLDTDSRLAAAGARSAFSLPYLKAEITLEETGDGLFYESRRTEKAARDAYFSVYIKHIASQEIDMEKGSLTEWLTERYCLWTLKGDKILKGPISHSPWRLKKAEAEWSMNGMTSFQSGRDISDKPIIQYCKEKMVGFHPFEKYGIADVSFNELWHPGSE
ncbi:YqjF family protein [Evansella clarkii]|uniref:YqjF family protein n=1 Tax=Evansella clarkii TaxID=79879 RepID=UPI0009989414|nr:DUF2071 domain-containing protein [Evansella clarkii]